MIDLYFRNDRDTLFVATERAIFFSFKTHH